MSEQGFGVALVAAFFKQRIAFHFLYREGIMAHPHAVVLGSGGDERELKLGQGLEHPFSGDDAVAEGEGEAARVERVGVQAVYGFVDAAAHFVWVTEGSQGLEVEVVVCAVAVEAGAPGQVEECRRVARSDPVTEAVAQVVVRMRESAVGGMAAGAGDGGVGGEDFVVEQAPAQLDAVFG